MSFLHNKINYSLDEYEKFPDFLKYIKLMDKSGNITFYDNNNKDPSKNLRVIIEKEKGENLKIMSLIAKRHKEKYL